MLSLSNDVSSGETGTGAHSYSMFVSLPGTPFNIRTVCTKYDARLLLCFYRFLGGLIAAAFFLIIGSWCRTAYDSFHDSPLYKFHLGGLLISLFYCVFVTLVGLYWLVVKDNERLKRYREGYMLFLEIVHNFVEDDARWHDFVAFALDQRVLRAKKLMPGNHSYKLHRMGSTGSETAEEDSGAPSGKSRGRSKSSDRKKR